MATVNFLYRSTKPEAFLNLRLLFRHKNADIVLGGKTKIKVSKDYWSNHHDKQRIKDIDIKNFQKDVIDDLNNIESHVLTEFSQTDPEKVNKEWLKNTIANYYSPPEQKPDVPKTLISFIDFYLERKQYELSEIRKKRIKVTKRKLERFENSTKHNILIKDVNDDFKNEYSKYCTKEHYSQNTQQTELSIIKTVCRFAHYLGLETSPQLKELRLKPEAVNSIYLTPNEVAAIKDLKLNKERLDNARDWLLISCYTGQRVSDFMRFTPDMIRIENGKHLLEFRQKKTGKLMVIPFGKEAREILNKRNGNFPRTISDQKYNDFIKEVCQKAGFKEMTKGKIIQCIAPLDKKPTRNDYRKITGNFEKWELVTSHIGRRSFATNHYGKVPTTYLMNITGHSTEKMFLNYIKKSNKDLALDAYEYFE